MAKQVREIMTNAPVSVAPGTSVVEVARRMRDEDIGAVLVTEGEQVRGLVTDRDLVVRVLSEGGDPDQHKVKEACSSELVSVSPDDEVSRAAQVMREHSVRRLPVLENGRAVGIVSLGDLAIERDPESALGDISSTKSNR